MSGFFRRRGRDSTDPPVTGDDGARGADEARRSAENAARGEASEQAARDQAIGNEERRQASDAEGRRQSAENETRRQASDEKARVQAAENEARYRSQDGGRDAGDPEP